MIRIILGIIVGYLVWTALWLIGKSLFFGEAARVVGAGERYSAAGPLAGAIVLSVVCSFVAGLSLAMIVRSRTRRAALVLSMLLLATGLFVQFSVWSLMPFWYHLVFLHLLIPFTLLGGRLIPEKTN